jgi:hypothetical protein
MKTISYYTVYVHKEYEPNTVFEEIIVATERGTTPIEKLVRKYLKIKYGDAEGYFIRSIDFDGDMILDNKG